MPSLVVFSSSGQLVTQEVREAELPQFVSRVYQPKLDSYIAAIADYISRWAASSINMVEAGKMTYDLWRAANVAISPYSNTLNAINSNATRSFSQQDQIDRLRTGIKNTSTQTIPNVDPSWWQRLTGASASALLVPLNALKDAAVRVKNSIVDRASTTAINVALNYTQTETGKKLVADAAARAGMSATEYLATPEGRKLIQSAVGDTGIKKLVTVLTVGSAVVLGSLAIWLLTRKR